MDKTLKTIQTIAKIGKILSKIVYIFCIVGAVFCAVGIISFSLGADEAFKLGGVNIRGLIQSEEGLSVNQMYAGMATGIAICVFQGILSKFAYSYFKNELKDGTPFTERGAKEMLRLGILAIALPLAAVITSGIINSVMNNVLGDIDKTDLTDFASAGTGVALIVMSIIFKYGAECFEKRHGEQKDKE
ncbi:MAG: hypothetical protein K6F09_09445 [Clostridiales bacterium]|nr:hypothetical protein [Clostridiales bacterium]